MNNEQRRGASFGAQPGGTGPFFRHPVLRFACVDRPHRTQRALAGAKTAAVAAIGQLLTGPNHMQDVVISLNAGSSSLKFSVFVHFDDKLNPGLTGIAQFVDGYMDFKARNADGEVVQTHRSPCDREQFHSAALDYLTHFLQSRSEGYQLLAVGHRVVHGGVEFSQPMRVSEPLMRRLQTLVPLAPLHQPYNLAAIRLLLERDPELPQVACFDTAFHTTQPDLAQRFGLAEEYNAAGIRRYGFHGLSYEYVASVLPLYDARAAAGRTAVMHLGNGASMCAFQTGKSIASSMGFTAVDGLPMGTRCGSLDPGVVLYLIDQRGMSTNEVAQLMYKESGLLGISGVSSDMRTLMESQSPRARLAVDYYVYRIGRELGSMAAALKGLDSMVFTAGVGENAAVIRERVCRDAAWLGVVLDPEANASGQRCISAANSAVSVWVVPTNEELMIAQHTLRIVGDD